MDNYSPNVLYFRVTYSDRALTKPSIEVFRYIGRNLSDEDIEETAYFEFMESYASETEGGRDETPKRVTTITKRDVSEMLDLDALISKLRAVEARIKDQN